MVLSPRPSAAQTPAESEGPSPQAPAPAPAPPPSEPPFVPPSPPPPSQTRLPIPFQPPARVPGVHLGPLFELHPTVGFTEEWTDNFRVSSTGRTQNFRSTLRSGLTLLINGPRTSGSISSNVGVSHDSSGDQIKPKIFPSITAAVRHTFDPRLSLTVTDSLQRSDEPGEADQFGLRRERRTFSANTLGIAADWLIDLIATQAYYRVSTFFSERDTVSHILGANATTPLGALDSLRLGYEFTMRETTGGASDGTSGGTSAQTTGHRVLGSYSHQIGQFASAGLSSSYSMQFSDANNSRIWNVSLHSAYGVPSGLSLSGNIGYSVFDSDRGGTRSTVSSTTTAAYRFVRAAVSVGVFQDFRQTADEGQDFGVVVTQGARATFTYELTPFISTNLRTSFSRNAPTGEGNNASDQATTTFSMGAGLSWQLLHWLSMRLDYTFTERSSNTSRILGTSGGSAGGSQTGGSSGSSKENRAVLGLSAAF